jgi:hypothetical protein
MGNISFSVVDTENHVEVVSNEGTFSNEVVSFISFCMPSRNVPKMQTYEARHLCSVFLSKLV